VEAALTFSNPSDFHVMKRVLYIRLLTVLSPGAKDFVWQFH